MSRTDVRRIVYEGSGQEATAYQTTEEKDIGGGRTIDGMRELRLPNGTPLVLHEDGNPKRFRVVGTDYIVRLMD